MSLRTKRWPLWPLSLTIVLMAGCGSPMGGPGATEQPEAPRLRVLQEGGDATPVQPGHGSRFMARLGLTPGQKARLKEIKADWPKPDRAQMKALGAQFETLLKAEPLNQDSLENLMILVLAQVNQRGARQVALAEKARGVLSESQRQQVAVAVLAHLNGTKSPGVDHAALALTPEQKAAFAWTKAMTRTRKMAALASFLLSGDQGALTQAWTVEAPEAKAKAMAVAIASMTVAQRTALIAQMERAHAQGHHGETE
jgi:hypothetical protein